MPKQTPTALRIVDIARLACVSSPSVIGWRGRIPADRCILIEYSSGGAHRVELLRPDLPWLRHREGSWPARGGRPSVDVVALYVGAK